ncbi:hypothetical protein Tco_0319848 [Tanacetum coccineum]
MEFYKLVENIKTVEDIDQDLNDLVSLSILVSFLCGDTIYTDHIDLRLGGNSHGAHDLGSTRCFGVASMKEKRDISTTSIRRTIVTRFNTASLIFEGDSVNEAVERTFVAREVAIDVLKFHLESAQNKMKSFTDKGRTDGKFEIGIRNLGKYLYFSVCSGTETEEGLLERAPVQLG